MLKKAFQNFALHEAKTKLVRLQKKAVGPGIINMVNKYIPRFDKLLKHWTNLSEISVEFSGHPGWEIYSGIQKDKGVFDSYFNLPDTSGLKQFLQNKLSKDYDEIQDFDTDLYYILLDPIDQLIESTYEYEKELHRVTNIGQIKQRSQEFADRINKEIIQIEHLRADIEKLNKEMIEEYEKVLHQINYDID